MGDGCRGCIACKHDEKTDTFCCILEIIPYISETEQCPCIDCLVKAICTVFCRELLYYNSSSLKKKIDIHLGRQEKNGR